jgi:hypothetical protein
MLEGKLVLARKRRTGPAADEVALLEAAEVDLDIVENRRDRAGPEDPAYD